MKTLSKFEILEVNGGLMPIGVSNQSYVADGVLATGQVIGRAYEEMKSFGRSLGCAIKGFFE